MTTKKCSKCEEVKPVAEYHKNKKFKDGYNSQCKKCIMSYNKNYRLKNKDVVDNCNSRYREKNREKLKNGARDYRDSNKDAVNARRMEYYYNNKEKVSAQKKKYYYSNKDQIVQKVCEYHKHKLKTNPAYRLTNNLRRRMSLALSGKRKADTTKALLGCTYEEARAHIEAQFTEGMSWDKMGMHGIHIDHIRPCASFDLSDPEQQRECFHYTNLQPLWAKDNLEKSDKW